MTTLKDEIYEIKTYIEKGYTFNVFSLEDSNELVELLEELELETIVNVLPLHNGNVYEISAAEQTYVTVEDYTEEEEGEGFEVVLNKYTYDQDGKVLDYSDKFLKSFKTLKGATNFAKKQGYKVKFI